MKKQNLKLKKERFEGFELTNNEMLNVKGGAIKGGDIGLPTPPPIRI